MNKKEILILILVCIAIFAVRLLYVPAVPYNDEYYWIQQAVNQDYTDYIMPHPPMTIWVFNIFYLLSHSLRLVPIILNILTFIFGFLILKEFTDNKNSYFWFYILYIFVFWNVFASVIIETDAFMTFFTTAALFFFIKYEKNNKNHWYFFSSIMFGLSLLTKATGFFILIILGVYLLIKTKSLIKSIKQSLPMLIIGLIMFSGYFFTMDNAFFVLQRSASFFSIPTPLHLLYLLIWGTPLLFIFLILSYKVISKKNMLLAVWIIVPLVIYFFGRAFRSPFDRYLMILIPPLLIIGALLIPKYIKTKIKPIFYAILFLIILLFTDQSYPYITHSISNYFHHLITFKWNFLLPITGPSGPVFGIPVILFMLISIISFISFLLILLNKNSFFLLLLSIGLAFNIHLVIQMEMPFNQPNINHLQMEMLEDMHNSNNLYSNHKSFRASIPGIKMTMDEDHIEGNVFILDYPFGQEDLSRYIQCDLIKKYQSHNQIFGYHYFCGGQS